VSLVLGVCDVIALAGFAIGGVVFIRTWSGERSPLSEGAKWFLVASAGVYVAVMANDAIDRVGLTSLIEPFEDSLELLFVPLVLVAVYSLVARQQLNDTRRAYEDLLQTGDMMVRAIESTPAGTVWLDTEGHIAFANPAARTMLDLENAPRDPETGEPDWTVRIGAGGGVKASIAPDFGKLVRREPLYDLSVIVEWPSGYRRRFSVNTAPTFGADSRLEGVIASFLDKEPWRVLQDRG
jgi:PAS domain-containing protein